MARRAKQEEIPGTASQERNDELHALGLEVKELETDRKAITAKEKEKRAQAAGILHTLGVDHYHVDGVEWWLEPGSEKVKVKLDADEKED